MLINVHEALVRYARYILLSSELYSLFSESDPNGSKIKKIKVL